MAVELYPYSGTRAGAMTDSEHERLWGGIPDGVLPGQSANALAVGTAGTTWTAQPGRFRIAGHVLDIDTVQSGAIPARGSATRTVVVVAYLDRTQTPWAKGVRLNLGGLGAGRPNLQTSPTGLYEVALRSFTIAPSGAVTFGVDERPFAAGSPWRTYTPNFTHVGSTTIAGALGRWRYVGPKHVKGRFQIIMGLDGSGTGPVTSSLPTAPSRLVRQAFHGHADSPGAILEAFCDTTGTGTTIDRIFEVNSTTTRNLTAAGCPRGRIFVVEFDYEEA